MKEIKAGEEWLKQASWAIRDERFAPIAGQARALWAVLRQQSNVELADIELVEVIAAGELRTHLRASGPGRYVVFDPAPLRRSLAARRAESTPTTLDERRSA